MTQRHNPPRHVKFNPKVTLKLRRIDLQAQQAMQQAIAPFNAAAENYILGLFEGHGIDVEGYDIKMDENRRGASLVPKGEDTAPLQRNDDALIMEDELPVEEITEEQLKKAVAEGEEVSANGTS